jgi:predicted permease
MNTDLRQAFRLLRNNPAFAITAIAALAFGIGANTAIFSAINAILVHPAGIAEPGRIAALRVMYGKSGHSTVLSVPDFEDVHAATGVFESAALMNSSDFNYVVGDTPQRLVAARVSHEWFDVFGVKPAAGRAFEAQEDRPGNNRVAILSDAAWKRWFGGTSSILGQTAVFNGIPFQIVGIMPASFRWPATADLWIPIGLAPGSFAASNRMNESYFTVARLRAGVSMDQADAAVRVIAERYTMSDATGYARASRWTLFAMPLLDLTAGSLKTPLLVLMGAVAAVLMIACSNIAGLLLARASGRTREIAVRIALGAGRWRLVRQLLTESFILALAGGIAGIGVGAAGIRALLLLAPREQTAGVSISLDVRVLLFTCTIAVLAGVLFGIAPAIQLSRLNQARALQEGGRAGTDGRVRQALRSALVVAELALALVLLAGAGLFLRSLTQVAQVDPGFRASGVESGFVTLPMARYAAPAKWTAFHRAAIERLGAIPGVTSAAAAIPLPFTNADWGASFRIESQPVAPGDTPPHGANRYVTPEYFATMGIALIRGREFTDEDHADAPRVALVDETLASRYWPNQDPIGQRIGPSSKGPWSTIVGVVHHIHQTDLEAANEGMFYQSLYQIPNQTAAFVVRAAGDPGRLDRAIAQAIREVDPSQAVYDMKTMQRRVDESLGTRRFAVTLLVAFAGLAVLLAALGIYGVINYTVARRTAEIGIRVALGANRRDVLGMIMGQGLRLSIAGVLAGAGAALVLARLVENQLFQVRSFDPITFGGVTIVLVAVALLASYLPARRAMRVDPMIALRYE